MNVDVDEDVDVAGWTQSCVSTVYQLCVDCVSILMQS